MMLILSVAVLLLCLTNCNSEEEKGDFAKNIPACIKKTIKGSDWVIFVDEYCTKNATKKIYAFLTENDHSSLPYILMGYDKNCNEFLINEEGAPSFNPIPPYPPGLFVYATLFPDGTIEYKDDIYHFKRTVFKQK